MTDIPEWDLADRMRKALRQAGISVQDIAAYLEVEIDALCGQLGKLREQLEEELRQDETARLPEASARRP